MSVLVVDDDQDLLEVLSRFLRRRGFVVHTACTPIGAGTIATEESLDVVVLDVLMPALDGGAIAEILRRRGDRVPIVFYTSMAVAEAQQLTQDVQDATVVSKNEGPNGLVAQIERVVRR